jgi:hypothetical protein
LNRICGVLAGSALLVLACGARADEARAPTEAEAAAAMERAKRLAANPMLRILEASKVRRRVVEPDVGETTADVAGARRSAATAGAALVAVTALGDGAVAPAARTAAAATPAAAAAEPAPGIAAQATLSSWALQARSALTSVPALEGAGNLAPVATQAQALPEPTLPAALVPTPRLVTMVEPEVPPRLLANFGAAVEVTAELTIRPDGRVASVTVPSASNRALHRYVVDALLQWVYEPLPSEQVLRVQLVFGAGT